MPRPARLFTPLPLPVAPAGQHVATMTPAPETTLTLQPERQPKSQKDKDNDSSPPKETLMINMWHQVLQQDGEKVMVLRFIVILTAV